MFSVAVEVVSVPDWAVLRIFFQSISSILEVIRQAMLALILGKIARGKQPGYFRGESEWRVSTFFFPSVFLCYGSVACEVSRSSADRGPGFEAGEGVDAREMICNEYGKSCLIHLYSSPVGSSI